MAGLDLVGLMAKKEPDTGMKTLSRTKMSSKKTIRKIPELKLTFNYENDNFFCYFCVEIIIYFTLYVT
jgi:hypothetical protein